MCVFLPLDAMEWYLMYVCGIFVWHVFVKGELVFLSFSQNKNKIVPLKKKLNCSICVLYIQ